MINVSNPFSSRPKIHQRTNQFTKIPTTRKKLYWSRSTGSAAGASVCRVTPKKRNQKLYLVVGCGGYNDGGWGNGNFVEPNFRGHASGFGPDPDYTSRMWIAPGGDLRQVGMRFDCGVTGLGSNAIGFQRTDMTYDRNLWSDVQVISNPTPANGNWNAIYDSWNTPGVGRAVSALTGTADGPGASGYCDYAMNSSSYPAMGGYIKIIVV